MEKPQYQMLNRLSDLEQRRHCGQEKQMKKKIEKQNKKKPHTKAATLRSKWTVFYSQFWSFNFNLNNKSQTVWKETQTIEPGTFPKWKQVPAPNTSHT